MFHAEQGGPPMLRLTNDELSAVMAAAAPLDPDARDGFVQAVAVELASCPKLAPARCIVRSARCSGSSSVIQGHRARLFRGSPKLGVWLYRTNLGN
jgi:hypothetical protein